MAQSENLTAALLYYKCLEIKNPTNKLRQKIADLKRIRQSKQSDTIAHYAENNSDGDNKASIFNTK